MVEIECWLRLINNQSLAKPINEKTDNKDIKESLDTIKYVEEMFQQNPGKLKKWIEPEWIKD